MKPEIKQKWSEALRSGDYKQGKHCLKNTDNEYCCLGVLAEITKDELGSTWTEDADEEGMYHITYGATEQSDILPPLLSADLGLSMVDQGQFAEMNDSGVTFLKIADYIEENL